MAFDPGCGPNVVRRSALPHRWEESLLQDQDLPALGDANGNPLKLMGKIVSRVRLGSATYRVLFVVTEHLAVSVIIGTSFMNRNVKVIMCMDQWIYLARSKVPIIAQHQGRRQVSEGDLHESQSPSAQESKQRTTKSNLNAPNTIRLAKHVTIPPFPQVAVPVTTQASGLVFIKPKHALQARHHVRTANGIVEVRENEKFMIVLSNFSKTPRKLRKNMVLAYATRNPLGICALETRQARNSRKFSTSSSPGKKGTYVKNKKKNHRRVLTSQQTLGGKTSLTLPTWMMKNYVGKLSRCLRNTRICGDQATLVL